MKRSTNFENLEVGESCIYHEGFLAADRAEREPKLDKEGNLINRSKGIEMKSTPRAIELDRIASIAYARSNICIIHKKETLEGDIIGTGELQLSQKLIKRQFGKRGLPIYRYIAMRLKEKPQVVIDMMR